MKFDPEPVRPENPDAWHDSAQNPLPAMSKATTNVADVTDEEAQKTLTERVLMFLDHHAA
jgi:hypothetical protein